jgi:hypothetical protein
MRVELDVDLRLARPEPEPKPAADPASPEEKLRRYQEERFLRRLALVRVIEARIAAGEFKDMAEVAQRCHVSRARMSKIMDIQTR